MAVLAFFDTLFIDEELFTRCRKYIAQQLLFRKKRKFLYEKILLRWSIEIVLPATDTAGCAFSLMTYDEVRKHSKEIVQLTQTARCLPGKPNMDMKFSRREETFR